MTIEVPNPQEFYPKDIFMNALNKELDLMEQSGMITHEQAEDKREAAAFISEGFSNRPDQDAVLFARMGVASEDEIVEILNGGGK